MLKIKLMVGPSPAQAQPATTPPTRYILSAAILLVLIVSSGFLAACAWTSLPSVPTQTETEFISASTFEERYGIRIRLIGVTAGGGMVDFRYKVLDPEKAKITMQDPENMPTLIVQDSGVRVDAINMIDNDGEWQAGRAYFILYSNTQGAIKPGAPVSVAIGDVHLEPILAQ